MGSDNPPHARSHELKQFQPARGQRQNLSEQEQREQREFEGRDCMRSTAQQASLPSETRLSARMELVSNKRLAHARTVCRQRASVAFTPGIRTHGRTRPGALGAGQGKFCDGKGSQSGLDFADVKRAARSRRHCCQRAFVAECPAVRVQTRTMKTVATPLA